MKYFKLFAFLLVFFVFVYLRITPIIDQTVPYTYDQGRDFLKAEEIIRDKNITFIGPTTGIQGVHHGAWWYYFLSFFYLIFNGLPSGFYIGLFVFSTLFILLFNFFILKELGWESALLFLLITSAGNFFVRLAFFASNNTLSPLFVLLLIYSVYQFFKYKTNKYLFLMSFALGFIFEFEIAFGLFTIIAFIFTSLFFTLFRKSYTNINKVLIFFSGFIISLLPRLLFELKNNFIQTKAFINFYTHPTSTNVQSFISTLIERGQLFIKYYLQLIPQENVYLGIIFLFLIIFLFIKGIKSINKIKQDSILFFSLLIFTVFLVSLISRNNFFWDYYLDGVQFIILFIAILIFNINILKNVKKVILGIFFISLLILFFKNLTSKSIPLIGLKADNKIINYFVTRYPKDYFCLRIYTPPVIPFTYMYLLSYYANQQKIKYPKGDYYKNQCYYIIDKEPYQFRIDKWREENIPKNTKLIEIINFENGTNIELWSF